MFFHFAIKDTKEKENCLKRKILNKNLADSVFVSNKAEDNVKKPEHRKCLMKLYNRDLLQQILKSY